MSGAEDTMQLFYRVAHAINASLKQEDTLQAILRAVREIPGTQAVVIRLLNPNADAMEVAASIDLSPTVLAHAPAAPGRRQHPSTRADRRDGLPQTWH